MSKRNLIDLCLVVGVLAGNRAAHAQPVNCDEILLPNDCTNSFALFGLCCQCVGAGCDERGLRWKYTDRPWSSALLGMARRATQYSDTTG